MKRGERNMTYIAQIIALLKRLEDEEKKSQDVDDLDWIWQSAVDIEDIAKGIKERALKKMRKLKAPSSL
jgi:hypothetical protein